MANDEKKNQITDDSGYGYDPTEWNYSDLKQKSQTQKESKVFNSINSCEFSNTNRNTGTNVKKPVIPDFRPIKWRFGKNLLKEQDPMMLNCVCSN